MTGPREDQPVPLPTFPNGPSDVPGEATVDELLDAYHRHLILVVGGRGNVELSDSFSARHAIAALVFGQVVVETFARERWPLVRDALLGGATPDDVAAAMGGPYPYEVAFGLIEWANRERREGRLTLDDADAVIALVDEIEGDAR